ncbi:MAG: 4Fe-4S binding protein [Candidatus Thorarchaeota archaeon]
MAFWRTPLDVADIEISRGVVHILDDRCKGCGYCIEFCPKEILVFYVDKLHLQSHYFYKWF